MTIGWILLGVGAILEITAFLFSAKLLRKREKGLDRKQAALDEKSKVLKDKVDAMDEQLALWQMVPKGYKAEPIKCMAIIGSPEELNEIELAQEKKRRIDDMTLGILRKCKERIEITETVTDMVRLRATLWVLERTTE